ncbi:hypothetical protein RJ639_042099 [Escallonia herrerae]|uniref:Autophagy-related protein 2 n=1 Tax=Escallonia herrerae TaxID=1293975 RepID=A0AA88WD56_9ASTE|nr:hypothetical protein RJ639_042099 [Escallonia herrerae]
MFSRWAIKKVCKFLLKKKLGRLILGDIDLEQLDVQLTAGEIKLSDLALNVDYINQKASRIVLILGAAATVVIKEGSIGSLSAKMPWNGEGCRIVVEELELVLAPCRGQTSQDGSKTSPSSQEGNYSKTKASETYEHEMFGDPAASASADVHEGVKAIAKMVKWLLTSFHVSVKRLIIAVDPSLGEENVKGQCRTLVLRIFEVECGTGISEDVSAHRLGNVDNFLGLSRLTNFIKFQGAILEFLEVNGNDNQTPFTTPVVSGIRERGGFSGTLKLSIPWKNGALDIRKVEADVYVDHLELRFQPRSIKWFLYLFEAFKNVGKNGKGHIHHKGAESVYYNAASHWQSPTRGSSEKVSSNSESCSSGFSSPMGKYAVLPGSNLISDWVPSSPSIDSKDRTEEEPDFGASSNVESNSPFRFLKVLQLLSSLLPSPPETTSSINFGNLLPNYLKLQVFCIADHSVAKANTAQIGQGIRALTRADSIVMDAKSWFLDGVLVEGIDYAFRHMTFIDQFFECFDGLRSSQTALGNSGMWNWTCSVFSAITAASNLASGSLHIPSEQKHVETSLKATIAGVSVLFSFVDEDHKIFCDPKGDQENGRLYVHYIGATFKDMLFVLQVCPGEMNFEAKVEHIELADHFSIENDVVAAGLHGGTEDIKSKVASIRRMQAAVQDALPPTCSTVKNVDIGGLEQSASADVSCGLPSMDRCTCTRLFKGIYSDDVVKVTLLRTSGSSLCQLIVCSTPSSDSFTGPVSFSLKLPPFVFWVNFHLMGVVLDLFKILGISSETRNVSASKSFDGKYRPSHQGDLCKSSCSRVTSLSPNESLRGNIFLPNARIIFCFPFEKDGDHRDYSSWDQFLALDFSLPLNLSEKKDQAKDPTTVASSKKRHTLATSHSLHLNVGNLDVYLISSASTDNVDSSSCAAQKLTFIAQTILSVNDGRGCLSVISMLWQEGPVTGPWIAKKAKLLATSQDSSTENKWVGKGYEFASVSTVEDVEDFNTRTRQEMILSSAFFMHAHLSPVTVKLNSSNYKNLHCLFHQLADCLSCLASDPVSIKEETSVSQTSILVDCDSVEISLDLEAAESIKGSIQSELPGSWNSLKLKIQKFGLLSVSNIGGILGANFLWVAHGEGILWGSITGVPDEEFLLISCKNSTKGRGDGEGSNVLSSRSSGSDIIYLWDPDNFFSHTSITVRCGTIVAIGGRVDWLDTISSFFSLPSPELEQAGRSCSYKGDSEEKVPCGSSFVLSLIDIGLSYEPYFHRLEVGEGFDSGASSAHSSLKMEEEYVGSLLAACSLKVSNTTMAGSVEREYKIRMQDVGLLLCAVSGPNNAGLIYSAEHLRKMGYVKVAQEAHVEAIVKTDCLNGHLWEVECSESHIVFDTCHDTASGLLRLAAQLQQLFAPDIEESVVHFQTRWNNVQQALANDGKNISDGDPGPSTSQVHTSSVDTKNKPALVNLMDEIREDAFLLDGNWDGQSDFCEPKLHTSFDSNLFGEVRKFSARDPECFSRDLSFTGSMPSIGLENSHLSFSQTSFPEFIEEYFLSDLSSLTDFSLNNQSSNKNGEVQRGKSGWYRDFSLRILENHVSDVTEQDVGGARRDRTRSDECKKVKGRVLLKNINVIWRLYAGSDWHNQNNGQSSVGGRDTTVCLELALSGIDFRYHVYPDGGICASGISLSVKDFRLNDCSNDAPWKLVLGYYQSKDHPRESSSKALKLDLEAVRPDPLTPLEEYRLHIALLPMRLHLHQCQLDFLINFFGGKSSSAEQSSSYSQDSGESRVLPKKSTNPVRPTITAEALLPYFQAICQGTKFDMWPVLVRVDYSPCRVDLAALRGGKYVELVNLVPWKLMRHPVFEKLSRAWVPVATKVQKAPSFQKLNMKQSCTIVTGVELQLKHVQAVGVYGWSCVCETIIGEWLEDISQNQIHKLLKGLPPIRSLVSVGSGAAKLVSLPVKNYRKDQRLLKGMQRGTIAFLRSISLEAIGLGVHLAAGAHDILLQAEYILTSITPSVPWPVQTRMNTNVRSNQPTGARQGMQQAAPVAVITPASAAARAAHCVLLGVRNSHGEKSSDVMQAIALTSLV